MVMLAGVMLVGCGGVADGGAPAVPVEANPVNASRSVAEQIIAANANADREMRLVARKLLNNDTEVAEFYEPNPGQILFSAAGSPTAGTVLRREQIQGKTASEVWSLVAPGEAVPQALAAAIERSQLPPSVNEPSEPARKAVEPSRPASGGDAPTLTADKIVPFSATGYCAGQFWQDWGNWGAGSSRNSQTLNWGWNYQSWSNVTGTAGYIVCPQGNVSNTGGRLTVNFPNGTTGSWNVAPNYYRWTTSTAGANCGWDVSCWGTRCTPNPFYIYGKYESNCYLTRGTSCGDNYDWITWASSSGSYCQSTGGNGGGGGTPGTCNLTCYANCGDGCMQIGTSFCSYQDAQVQAPGCGVYCGNDPANSATCYTGH
jgi:hypothetical protein